MYGMSAEEDIGPFGSRAFTGGGKIIGNVFQWYKNCSPTWKKLF